MQSPLDTRPIRVRGVKIAGAKRTRISTIESELLSAYEARTLGELANCITNAQKSYESFGVFKSVHIHIAATEQKGVADLYVVVEEVNIPKLRVQLSQENSGTAFETAGALRNILGNAETLDFEGTLDGGGSSNFRCALRQPHPFGSRVTAVLEGFQQASNASEACGCSILSTGGRLTLYPDASRHSWTIEAIKRGLGAQKSRPFSSFMHTSQTMLLRQVMNPSFKCSLRHTFRWTSMTNQSGDANHDGSNEETGDLNDLPSQRPGFVDARITSEAAGLGGDVSFFKSLLDITASKILTGPYWGGQGLECKTRFLGGILIPMSPRYSSMGPAPMLGFEDRRVGGQVGERNQTQVREMASTAGATVVGSSLFGGGHHKSQFYDAMGGDIMMSLSTMLKTPLPFSILQSLGVKGLMHVSAGNLSVKNSWPGFRSFIEAARVSAGIGFILPTPLGDVTVTYSRAVSGVTSTDTTKRFQVGLGVDFSKPGL